jgi:hypothetical protein
VIFSRFSVRKYLVLLISIKILFSAQLKNFERETNPVDGPANRQPLALIWAPAPHQQQTQQQQQPQQQQQLQHQQHQHQQQLQQQQQAVNLMNSSNTFQSDRTYTELQTVRSTGSQGVTDATQVLRQHHQQEKTTTTTATSSDLTILEQNPERRKIIDGGRISDSPLTPAAQAGGPLTPGHGGPLTPGGKHPHVLKQEAMTPMSVRPGGTPGSVRMVGAKHAPPSVSVVPLHMAQQMQDSHGKIGRGDKVVSFSYEASTFGPIYAKDEEEVKAIFDLANSKMEERQYRDKHGGRRSSGVWAKAAATRARSTLPPDVVSYLGTIHILRKHFYSTNFIS